jgi:LPXTG-motif cell wall-anchored protein
MVPRPAGLIELLNRRIDMKRMMIAAAVVVAGAFGVAGSPPAAADQVKPGQEVCGPLDSGKIDTSGDPLSVPVSAPPGMVITGYCVKAGSDQSVPGGAVRYVSGLSVTTLTIKHPSGKAVSHYSLSYGEPDDEVNPVTPEVPTGQPGACTTEGSVTVPADTESYNYNSETIEGVTIVTVQAVGDARLTGDVGPWRFSIAKTTGADCDTDESVPPSLRIAALSPVCIGDIPYIDYAIALDGLDPTGKSATLTIRDRDGNQVAKYENQPLAGRILYPGASAIPQDWPGWVLLDGKWQFDPSDARLREGVTVTAEVNPSATGSVAYPSGTEACKEPQVVAAAGPVPAAAATVTPTPVPSALPSTGSSSWMLALAAAMLVLAGSGFVILGRRSN